MGIYVGNRHRIHRWRNWGIAMAGGGTPYVPSGMNVWYDFSDASTLFVDAGVTPVSSDGDLIYQANDKSGNGHHISNSTAGGRPTYKVNIKNGLSVGRGDGGDQLETTLFAVAQPLTIFSVCMISTLGGSKYIGAGFNLRTYFASSNRIGLYGGVGLFSSNDVYAANEYILARFTANGASSLIHKNGVQVASGNIGTGEFTTNFYLFSRGSSDFLTGDIGEYLVYGGLLSETSIFNIESYLTTKWAI